MRGIRCEGRKDRAGWGQQDCWLQPASPSVEHSLRVQGILPAAGGSWAKGKAVLILFVTGGDSFFGSVPRCTSVLIWDFFPGPEGALFQTVEQPEWGCSPRCLGDLPQHTRRVRRDEAFRCYTDFVQEAAQEPL